LPAARLCQRVAFNIFLCFFLRMRLRRFLIRDPMSVGTLAEQGRWRHTPPVGVAAIAVAGVQEVGCDGCGAAMEGRAKRNSAPPPGAWCTLTWPPSSTATWATMASPRPDPGRLRASGAR